MPAAKPAPKVVWEIAKQVRGGTRFNLFLDGVHLGTMFFHQPGIQKLIERKDGEHGHVVFPTAQELPNRMILDKAVGKTRYIEEE